MALFEDSERARAEALVRLGYFNPFLPERIDLEREVLGKDFVDPGEMWHKQADDVEERPNIDLMMAFSKALADRVRARLLEGGPGNDADGALYEDVALYYIYNKYKKQFFEHIRRLAALASPGQASQPDTMDFYTAFRYDMEHYLAIDGATFPSLAEAEHLFACFYQLRNAFHQIYDNIIGGSAASARLRASVWDSIFTCDVRRYRRALYDRMGDITTLVTGPSGTGKELVARAIGLSRYVPFNAHKMRFEADFAARFQPINLSALSPTLIESELFGHAKGSFTGAVRDRAGFFEVCPTYGSVFLDEIGDLDPAIQVKLLRVLQTGTFQRIGESADRHFGGKIIAATNRDLAKQMHDGRFREDLYYRLCSDIIVTPSLREQLQGSPEQLRNLLRFIARRVAGDAEADALAAEVEGWITDHLGPDYSWPGNVRELEQCVRNVMVRRSYHPPQAGRRAPREALAEGVRAGELTAEALQRHYVTMIYAETGSYQAAAARLGLDRRTVKSYVDSDLLQHYRGRSAQEP